MVKGVIIAAGKGVRLRPFTETRPKPLIPVLNKPLLYWIIRAMHEAGVDDIIVVISYMADEIRNAMARYISKLPVHVRYVEQGGEDGTADAVEKAISHTGLNEEFVLVYGDILVEPWIIKKLLETPSGTDAIIGISVTDPRDYGLLAVDSANYLNNIIEKPTNYKGPGLVFAGLGKFDASYLVHYLDKTGFSERGEREFTETLVLMSRHKRIKVVEAPQDAWVEMGKPWNIIDINKWLLQRQKPRVEGEIEENVVIKGDIVIEEGAVIKSGTYIIGPVYISENAEIGPHAYIRPYSVIGEGSRIGFSVEVKESVVMEHVHASHLAYIGDSVIGEYTNLGAGTITANLRFDNATVKVVIKGKRIDSGRRKLGAFIGAYVRTGINVSIFPGVKIGSYSWIYPGCMVDEDVPPNTILKCRQEMFVKDLRKKE